MDLKCWVHINADLVKQIFRSGEIFGVEALHLFQNLLL